MRQLASTGHRLEDFYGFLLAPCDDTEALALTHLYCRGDGVKERPEDMHITIDWMLPRFSIIKTPAGA